MRISLKSHLEALRRAERERTNILFTIATGMATFVYWELGRRQKINEGREDARREYVDGELSRLSDGELGHRERSEGVRNIGRLIAGTAGVVLTIVTLLALLASHAI